MRSSASSLRVLFVALLFLLVLLDLPLPSSSQARDPSRSKERKTPPPLAAKWRGKPGQRDPPTDEGAFPDAGADARPTARRGGAGVPAPAPPPTVLKAGPSPNGAGRRKGAGDRVDVNGAAGEPAPAAEAPAAKGSSNGWLKDIPAEVQQPYLLNIGTGKGQSDIMLDDVVVAAYAPRIKNDDSEEDEGGNEIHELEDFYIWRKAAAEESSRSARSITSTRSAAQPTAHRSCPFDARPPLRRPAADSRRSVLCPPAACNGLSSSWRMTRYTASATVFVHRFPSAG